MKLTLANFEAEKAKMAAQVKQQENKTRIYVGLGTCGIAAGGGEIMSTLQKEVADRGLDADLISVGCIGMCEQEPLVDVALPGMRRVTYARVTPELAKRIVAEHVVGGHPVSEAVIAEVEGDREQPYPTLPFYKKQKRIVLRNCGFIDPEKIEEYIASDGYSATHKVLSGVTPDAVIAEVKASGLRGRGGAGFPTGLKWEFARKAAGPKKYVVCNADEGDPGAFMDRSVLEGDPHAILEGMIMCAYAIGSDEGYIYCRAEYPLAIKHLKLAIAQAEEMGLLGDHILGTDFNFHIHIKEGAGAFVCGEETALFASIMGERGMPRPRPPFPAEKGLWEKPTNNNNVETYANIPAIIRNGGAWYGSVGTEKSKGTKVFALTGKIKNTGLAEVPMGLTLREVVYDIGGGIQNDRAFKAAQIGGPSGGCIPASLIDTPVDYESLTAAGAMMGSGGLVIVDDTTCMVDFAKFFLNFTRSESCGKCTPCREGTTRMYEMLDRITTGKGSEEELALLEELAPIVKDTSLCGLGQTAPNPILTTLRYFRDEYDAHVKEKRCPSKVCTQLLHFTIVPDLCRGCNLCKKGCPSGAISGELKGIYKIDPEKCTRCGSCETVCAFNAVVRV